MRVLQVHNYYRQPGGEDHVVHAEKELLLRANHEVISYIRHNDEISHYGLPGMALLPLRTLWAGDTCREFKGIIKKKRPDVAHFHNTFPLISPAAYYSCHEAGVPVVQTLHNPRLMCPAATFFRKGQICQDCLGRTPPWPGVLHACYRGSRIQTGAVAAMLAVHRWLRTWETQVDLYIVFTEFYRRKFIEGGLSPEQIVVKPHFCAPDPGLGHSRGSYALFIGRLAPEKGILTLLNAWKRLKNIPLRIRGEGPLLGLAQEFVSHNGSCLQLVPRSSPCELTALIKGARFLVWPSQGYYETFGRVAMEAFACGVPVIASRVGAMEEIVDDHRTGLHFTPGDPHDLAAKVEWAWSHPDEMAAMGQNARAEYEEKYTAERNYEMLMRIYERARRMSA